MYFTVRIFVSICLDHFKVVVSQVKKGDVDLVIIKHFDKIFGGDICFSNIAVGVIIIRNNF